jgi:Flp pilus assembly protein TadG
MRIPSPRRDRRRRAATLVESSMVLSIFLLFLFGIIEYARFVMIYQGMQNAAREGARYAVAVINPESVSDANVQAEVQRRLKGLDPNLKNFQITVSAIVMRGGVQGTPLPYRWNAQNTDGVVVQINYTFKPALPSFLRMGKTVPMTARCVMYAEGN